MSRRRSQPPSEESLGVLAAFRRAYGDAPRPAVYGNPGHCDECAEAHTLLMARTPEDLDPEELAEPSRSWFFAWMGEAGWRHFLPGFVRLALLDPGKNAGLLLGQLQPEFVRTLTPSQRAAIHTVLEHMASSSVAFSPATRRVLRQSLEATRSTGPADQTA
jgi:hypothetical protein